MDPVARADRGAGAAGTWPLGDVRVNRLGLGAMRLTGAGAFDRGVPRDRDAAVAVVRRAVELGVDHLDTAAFYFSGALSANEVIAEALSSYTDGPLVATKVGPSRDPSGSWRPWPRPEELRAQVEQNLRGLRRDHLDLVNLRMLGSGPLTDHLGALVELQREGLVRRLGLSNVRREQLVEACGVADIVCVQNRYSLDSRREDADEVVAQCRDLGVAFVPYFAIAGEGRESGVPPDQPSAVLDVARAHGVSPAQVRLAWSLSRGPHVLAIPGTGDLAHLQDNVAAASLRLTEHDLVRLASVGSRQARPTTGAGPTTA